MKLFYIFLILFLFLSCSFDNKTGIWKNENNNFKQKKIFNDFKKIGNNKKSFDEVIEYKKKYIFKIPNKINNDKWEDIFFNQFNNYINFAYNDQKNIIFKSKKISKHKLSKKFLFNEGNLVLTDHYGNLIIFSLKEKKIITKFNFYKKKYPNLNKNLNIILKENIIYVTDNLGFIYAFDYKKNKILWAQDNKIPFRSNLKIKNNKLIASDQNNIIYLFDMNNGNILKLIPTEETKIKNSFINNFSLNDESFFMLNSYGSLYSIDNKSTKIKWMINLNQSLDINTSNLFNGHQLINNNHYIIVSSQDSTYVINSKNGSINSKFNIISNIKPLLVDNYLFLISSNNLFICIDIINSEIVYSLKINQKIANFLDIKKQIELFDDIFIANNRILVVLKSGYLAEFEMTGNLKNIFKLPAKIYSNLIFVNNSILYLDNKNRLILLG